MTNFDKNIQHTIHLSMKVNLEYFEQHIVLAPLFITEMMHQYVFLMKMTNNINKI